MQNTEIEQLIQEFETEEKMERPETTIPNVENEAIPVIIDVGYYTSPKYWGKISDNENETIQFMINMATIEANNMSMSHEGTIFQRWNIKEGNQGYITPEQRLHIRRAVCLITDVFENADFDRTKGSYSFSLPGMSASQSSSENNLVVPQSAINELQMAGFYLVAYSKEHTVESKCDITEINTCFEASGNEELNTPITIANADNRYIRQFQPNVLRGSIPRVNVRQMVEFARIEDIINESGELEVERVRQIYDPNTGTFKHINEFNVNYFGGWTAEQIINAIIASNTTYNPLIDYVVGFVVLSTKADGTFTWYQSIKSPNIGNQPSESPEYWRELPNAPIDINLIIEQLKPFIVEQTEAEVTKQLNELPTIDNIIYPANIWTPFESKDWFDNNVKTPYNLVEGVDYVVYDKTLLNDISGNLSVINNPNKDNLFSPKWYFDNGNQIDGGKLLGAVANGTRAGNSPADIPNNANLSLVADLSAATKENTDWYIVKFNKDIIKKSVVKVGATQNYTFTSPLVESNGNVSIESTSLDKWNGYETQISDNTNAISQINQSLSLYATINFVNSELAKYLDKETYSQDKANIESKITTNTSDIASIKVQQNTQDSQIASNRDLSNQIIAGLRTLRVFDYIGIWNATTTYLRNQAVEYNGRLFSSKADDNLNNTPPSNNQSNTYWLLINSVQATVDLSNYYTKPEIANILQEYLTIATYTANMQQLEARLGDIESAITDLDSQLDAKLDTQIFNEFKTQYDTKQQEQDTLINEKANTSDLDNYVKKNSDNTLTGVNEFKNNVYFNGDKTLNFGYSKTDTKLQISAVPRVKDSMITNPQGYIYYKKAMDPTDSTDVANKKYVDNSLVNKQDVLMWKNKVIKNIVFEDSKLCIDWLNDNNSKIKVISYRGFGVHQGGYYTPIPWNYTSNERLWIQFNPNTGKWFWKESSDFIPINMYVLIVEYVEM